MEEFKERIAAVHKSLDIPKEYENGCGLILHFEASDLVEIENDIYGRPQRLRPKAASAWGAMKGKRKVLPTFGFNPRPRVGGDGERGGYV